MVVKAQNASQFIASIARVVLGALALSAILGRNFSNRLLHCRDESLFPPFLLWILPLMRVTGRMAYYPFVIVSFLSAFLLCYVRTDVVTSYSLIYYVRCLTRYCMKFNYMYSWLVYCIIRTLSTAEGRWRYLGV